MLVVSINEGELFDALTYEFDDGFVFSLPSLAFSFHIAAEVLLQIVGADFDAVEHFLLRCADLLQLLLHQQQLSLKLVNQFQQIALPQLLLTLELSLSQLNALTQQHHFLRCLAAQQAGSASALTQRCFHVFLLVPDNRVDLLLVEQLVALLVYIICQLFKF